MKPQVSHDSPATRRTPATPTDRQLFGEHYAALQSYTDRLRSGRCRRTQHFDAHRLGPTLTVFAPLFAPWNMQIVFALYMRGPLGFNDSKRLLAPISSRVLSDKLAHLRDQGLVQRAPREGRSLYALTPKGEVAARHLHPLLFYLHDSA